MRFTIAAAACIGVAVARPARAQSIHGQVVDERGAPVARAEVQIVPSGHPSFTDAAGGFDLGVLSKGAYRVRARRVGYELTLARVVIPLADSSLVIVLPHSALALDTMHTTALEQQLPRLFDRLQNHLGAALYGPALDSVFARGGSRDLTDMMTVDRRFAAILRRPYCAPTRVYIDNVEIPGTLNTDMGMANRPSKFKSLASMGQKAGPPDPFSTADLEMYISQKDIAAIEVFDSTEGVHEPGIFPSADCARIVLIWSKYYKPPRWAGR